MTLKSQGGVKLEHDRLSVNAIDASEDDIVASKSDDSRRLAFGKEMAGYFIAPDQSGDRAFAAITVTISGWFT